MGARRTSRRSVVAGAAWATPVVISAAAAPAYAASCAPRFVVSKGTCAAGTVTFTLTALTAIPAGQTVSLVVSNSARMTYTFTTSAMTPATGSGAGNGTTTLTLSALSAGQAATVTITYLGQNNGNAAATFTLSGTDCEGAKQVDQSFLWLATCA